MRNFSIIFILFATIYGNHALDQAFVEKFMEKIQQFAEECVEETGATDDDLAELIAKTLPPTTHEAKCMIFCVNKKFGIQTNNGEIDKVGALLAIDELKTVDLNLYKEILKIFIECGQKVKMDVDPCENASNMAVCFKDEAVAAKLDETLLV